MSLKILNTWPVTDGGPVDIETEREVWEGLKHTHFVSYSKDGGDTARSSKVPSQASPERSKSELKYSPKTPVLQRSHSSPMSEAADTIGKPRSRSSSDAKFYRPLQGQLSQIEGETMVIREQTEISHITDKEKSELSKLSEKADLADLKSELTLPADIAEEETIEDKAEDVVEKTEEAEEAKVELEEVKEDEEVVVEEVEKEESVKEEEPVVDDGSDKEKSIEIKSEEEQEESVTETVVKIPGLGEDDVEQEEEEEVEEKEEEKEEEVKEEEEVEETVEEEEVVEEAEKSPSLPGSVVAGSGAGIWK